MAVPLLMDCPDCPWPILLDLTGTLEPLPSGDGFQDTVTVNRDAIALALEAHAAQHVDPEGVPHE